MDDNNNEDTGGFAQMVFPPIIYIYIIYDSTWKLTSIFIKVIINLHPKNPPRQCLGGPCINGGEPLCNTKFSPNHQIKTRMTTKNTTHRNSFPTALPPNLTSWLQTNNPYIYNIPTDDYVININKNSQPGATAIDYKSCHSTYQPTIK